RSEGRAERAAQETAPHDLPPEDLPAQDLPEDEAFEESVDEIIERQEVVLFDRPSTATAKPARGGRRGRDRDDDDGEPAPGETAFGDHVPAFMLRSAKVA